MWKQKVKVIATPSQSELKKGDIGYIHAYARMGDAVTYAVVITETKIDIILPNMLRPIHSETEKVNFKNQDT